ncbi:hypothetical protein EHP00_1476 [Ecytonucleospora hepatopenaei]|uniref:Uncharacterized protein n=1 Tax=Ecytonucleospora hepatopenaei TaxID=646526 RepID=A0A1W0E760_9MICR|nr:hypothetical protein EHP00_1476 [Ecytonucleospora hepatopenaei]
MNQEKESNKQNNLEIFEENLNLLCKNVQETDKEIRKLIEDSKFLTLHVSTSSLSHKIVSGDD